MPTESTYIRVWTQGSPQLCISKDDVKITAVFGHRDMCHGAHELHPLAGASLSFCSASPPTQERCFFHHVLRYQTNPTLHLSSAAPPWYLASFGSPKSQMFCSWLWSGTRDREIGQPCTLMQRSCERLQKPWSGCTCGLLALLFPNSPPWRSTVLGGGARATRVPQWPHCLKHNFVP